jgi:hypothetical protein
MHTLVIAIVILLTAIGLLWRFRPRRSNEPGFKYVYVNHDGSVREVSPVEQAEFLLDESMAPSVDSIYKKSSFTSRDGWGSLSGFIERRLVPARIKISPVPPEFDARKEKIAFDVVDLFRAAGDFIETHTDGSVECIPNPKISPSERFELLRKRYLANQQQREKLTAQSDDDTAA